MMESAPDTRPRCSSNGNGASFAKANSNTVSGSVSSSIAARMSGAWVVRFTIRLMTLRSALPGVRMGCLAPQYRCCQPS